MNKEKNLEEQILTSPEIVLTQLIDIFQCRKFFKANRMLRCTNSCQQASPGEVALSNFVMLPITFAYLCAPTAVKWPEEFF